MAEIRRGPWLEREVDGFTYSLLVGEDGITGYLDVHVWGPESRHWCGTLATFEALLAAMDNWEKTGECLNGAYIWNTGLVILRDLSAESAFAVLEDLVRSQEISMAFEEVIDE